MIGIFVAVVHRISIKPVKSLGNNEYPQLCVVKCYGLVLCAILSRIFIVYNEYTVYIEMKLGLGTLSLVAKFVLVEKKW
jgi:hypothetical protein